MSFFQSLAITVMGGAIGANSCNALNNDVVNIGHPAAIKHIKLLTFEKERLQKPSAEFSLLGEMDYSKGITPFTLSAGAVDLGMANVPVLDQGNEGTCVTFSTTAAIDTLLVDNKLISQQCSLALDLGLGTNYWNGANYPSEILHPLQTYGIVLSSHCPSVYPNLSERLGSAAYQVLADPQASAIVRGITYSYSATPNLSQVKLALKGGHRVLMAFTLNAAAQEAVQGFNVQMLGKQHQGGLWACKQGGSPNYCVNSLSGHEILVVGYDDKQQLLKIRNSWSANYGDNGSYYMTYSFYSKMAVDFTVIN